MKKEEKNKAINLRQKGYSFCEISKELNVAKSTVSLWTKDVELNKYARFRLKQRILDGKSHSLNTNRKKREDFLKHILNKDNIEINKIYISKEIAKLVCSILYWCEGSKDKSTVRFTNSDPVMISTFLNFFRKAFETDEEKFRVCMHLHSYHDETMQKKFWMKITGISEAQFIKSYRKDNTGIRQKKDYQGCISIRYHDYIIATEINNFYNIFGIKYGGLS